MEKKNNAIFGFFGGQIEVQEKIESLREAGYSSDHMYVIAKENEQINALHTYSEVHFSTEKDGDWIDKFRELFSDEPTLKNVFGEMGFSREEAEDYNRRIENGEIFLYVDDDKDGNSNTKEQMTGFDKKVEKSSKMSRAERRKLQAGESEKMLLHEEQLEVEKEQVQTGEVNVSKRIVEEQQDLDVPVERDDVTVERRPVTDNGEDGITREPYQVGDELHIPIVEEKLVVTKREVVTEEIVITKKKVSETEHISETLRREKIDIDENKLSENKE